jgi:hypothetical protein
MRFSQGSQPAIMDYPIVTTLEQHQVSGEAIKATARRLGNIQQERFEVGVSCADFDQARVGIEEEAVRYDLLVGPLIEALREAAMRLGAQMVLLVAGRSPFRGLEPEWDGSIGGDAEFLGAVRSIAVPPSRAHHHHHLTEAVRLINSAATQYYKRPAVHGSIGIGSILQPLKAGWQHLQSAASSVGGMLLIDLRPCCFGGCRSGDRN